jgi:hypothetical protein
MWTSWAGSVVLTLLALAPVVGFSDDGHKSAPADPDPSFLEFLGSVDRMAEVNPDYLAQAGRPPAANAPAKGAAASPPPSPPPPPAASAPGVKNNDQ